MGALPWIAAAAVALAVALLTVPRLFIRRAQDRLAEKTLASEPGAWKLLTRADMVAGLYRRVPGILGLSDASLEFAGLYGESTRIATTRIGKIETGTRLASGRLLFRLEVLRVTRSSGEAVEFVISPPAASAWRSHLGLWAMAERQADVDRVSPGKN